MTSSGSIIFNGQIIPYNITYSPRRNSISIIVHHSKRVEIKVPSGTPASYIHGLAEKKASWILKRLMVLDSLTEMQVERKYHAGEIFFFLGTPFILAILTGNPAGVVRCDAGHLVVNNPWPMPGPDRTNYTRKMVQEWYRDQASWVIEDKVRKYSHVLEVDQPPFKLKNIRRRWGSCSHKNTLNFNIRLVMAPIALVDYVVLHELCHIRHKNHSGEFWESLRAVMPDYPERRELLKKEGYRYVL